VLGRGGDVAAEGVAILGACFAGEPSGDVLLDFAGPKVAFGLVGGGWYLQVVGEAQDVGFAVAQHLEQESGFALSGAGAVGGGVGQSDAHPVPEPVDQRVADGVVEWVATLVAGQVGLVDQLAQRIGELGRPGCAGVDLGGTSKIPE
jgi:hypothetical protein